MSAVDAPRAAISCWTFTILSVYSPLRPVALLKAAKELSISNISSLVALIVLRINEAPAFCNTAAALNLLAISPITSEKLRPAFLESTIFCSILSEKLLPLFQAELMPVTLANNSSVASAKFCVDSNALSRSFAFSRSMESFSIWFFSSLLLALRISFDSFNSSFLSCNCFSCSAVLSLVFSNS